MSQCPVLVSMQATVSPQPNVCFAGVQLHEREIGEIKRALLADCNPQEPEATSAKESSPGFDPVGMNSPGTPSPPPSSSFCPPHLPMSLRG